MGSKPSVHRFSTSWPRTQPTVLYQLLVLLLLVTKMVWDLQTVAALTQQYKGAIFSLQRGIWLHLVTQLSFFILGNSIISYVGEAHSCQCHS